MVEVRRVLEDPLGLHARLVALLTGEVRSWGSAVVVHAGDTVAAGDNLMQLMALDAPCGRELRVQVAGPDEGDAARGIAEVLEQM